VHEAKLLHLATDKAGTLLGWFPVWHFPQTIAQTVSWYRETAAQPQAAASLISNQIARYTSDAAQAALPWATRPLTSDL
jgi:CDP-glucose 4,6-dehydratase